MNDGSIHFDEVKGFFRDDAKLKFKMAREKYPMFTFHVVRRKGGKWEIG